MDLASLAGTEIVGVHRGPLDGPHQGIPGLGGAWYFEVVLEIRGRGRFLLSERDLAPWASDPAGLTDLRNENALGRIASAGTDPEGQFLIRLETGYVLRFETDHGSHLVVEHA